MPCDVSARLLAGLSDASSRKCASTRSKLARAIAARNLEPTDRKLRPISEVSRIRREDSSTGEIRAGRRQPRTQARGTCPFTCYPRTFSMRRPRIRSFGDARDPEKRQHAAPIWLQNDLRVLDDHRAVLQRAGSWEAMRGRPIEHATSENRALITEVPVTQSRAYPCGASDLALDPAHRQKAARLALNHFTKPRSAYTTAHA